MMAIGRSMRRAREGLEQTQEQVANSVGISAQFYGRIERGTALPSVGTLKRLSEHLDVSADELLGLPDSVLEREGPEHTADVQAYLALDSLPVRRAMRRLRVASRSVRRLVAMLLEELERS